MLHLNAGRSAGDGEPLHETEPLVMSHAGHQVFACLVSENALKAGTVVASARVPCVTSAACHVQGLAGKPVDFVIEASTKILNRC